MSFEPGPFGRNESAMPRLNPGSIASESPMPSAGCTPKIVPYGTDQTVYLVIDRYGGAGTVYRETEVELTDLETMVGDLISGQFNARCGSLPSIRLCIGR
jgi:hypothetical protein